jgi:hypothetical protein
MGLQSEPISASNGRVLHQGFDLDGLPSDKNREAMDDELSVDGVNGASEASVAKQ